MKKRLTLIFSLVFMLGLLSQAQTYRILVKPVGEMKWKYADLEGKIVINSEFPICNSFSSDGVAVVHTPKKNLYQLIDVDGNIIQSEIGDFYLKDAFGYGVKGFSDGVIIVKQGRSYGLMNTKGQRVSDSKFTNIVPFNGGYATGRIANSFYIINQQGEEKQVDIDGMRDMKAFSEGLAPYTSKDKLLGFLNTKGEVIIQAQFRGVGFFNSGLAWARAKDGLIGFINPKGEWVIEPRFVASKNFDKESCLAKVKQNDQWGYVNTNGDFFTFKISETVHNYAEGIAKGRVGIEWGFYSNDGKWIIEPQFQGVRDFKNGFAAAKKDDLWGIIDKQGNWVLQPKYAGIKDVVEIKDMQIKL